MQHFKRICKKCKTIMDQCRCFNMNKQVILDLCDSCKSGKKPVKVISR